jgi:hypothetical protein
MIVCVRGGFIRHASVAGAEASNGSIALLKSVSNQSSTPALLALTKELNVGSKLGG